MMQWLVNRRLERFERRFDYDMAYARDILRAGRRAFWRFSGLFGVARHREGVPLAAWHAAKLLAARQEDCGPCVQLIVDMALADGVEPASLRRVWQGEWASLPSDMALACQYAEAVLQRSATLGHWRDEVERRWGPRGLVSLALSMTGARAFPMLKYALGHGHQCQRVRIGHDTHPATPSLIPDAL